MAGVRGWRGALCAAVMAAGVVGIARGGAEAQTEQQARPRAPALGGDAARGRYLVEHVAMCGECHSSRDQAGNLLAATFLQGGPMPVIAPWAVDWPVQVPRIAGLPGYSDAEACAS